MKTNLTNGLAKTLSFSRINQFTGGALLLTMAIGTQSFAQSADLVPRGSGKKGDGVHNQNSGIAVRKSSPGAPNRFDEDKLIADFVNGSPVNDLKNFRGVYKAQQLVWDPQGYLLNVPKWVTLEAKDLIGQPQNYIRTMLLNDSNFVKLKNEPSESFLKSVYQELLEGGDLTQSALGLNKEEQTKHHYLHIEYEATFNTFLELQKEEGLFGGKEEWIKGRDVRLKSTMTLAFSGKASLESVIRVSNEGRLMIGTIPTTIPDPRTFSMENMIFKKSRETRDRLSPKPSEAEYNYQQRNQMSDAKFENDSIENYLEFQKYKKSGRKIVLHHPQILDKENVLKFLEAKYTEFRNGPNNSMGCEYWSPKDVFKEAYGHYVRWPVSSKFRLAGRPVCAIMVLEKRPKYVHPTFAKPN